MWITFWIKRNKQGQPEQRWSHDVYLTDHFEVYESKAEAVKQYKYLIKRNYCHSAGIAPIDETYATDWN